MKCARIGNKMVGDGYPCFISREAGATHTGLESAKALVAAKGFRCGSEPRPGRQSSHWKLRMRGRGYGTAILATGTAYALKNGFAAKVRGIVRLSNAASLRCFIKAGFKRLPDAEVNGVSCAVFEWSA
ncbi:MAG: hypothetical protein WBD75_10420 [Phycisphaerae bacterium]